MTFSDLIPSDPTQTPGLAAFSESARHAVDFLIGPKLCGSPVKSITHFLGRRGGTDKYYLLKILSLTIEESQDERQGKLSSVS